MANPTYLYRCPNCQSETPSNGEAETCPECGTRMRQFPNNRGVRELDQPGHDPRRAFPTSNRQHRPI